MASISTSTFQMGQKHPLRLAHAAQIINGSMTLPQYQDYSYRDVSAKNRIRRWDICHNLFSDQWIFTKYWTTALPGESHYVRIPKKIEKTLRILIDRDFPIT